MTLTKPLLVDELQHIASETAQEKGWRDRPRELPEVLALIHSEISEALTAYRDGLPPVIIIDGKPEGYAVEIADAIIRCVEYLDAIDVCAEYVLELKLDYNKTRDYRHGNKKI